MRVVTGYVGQNEINIAAERGEVQGNNTGLSNLTVNRADWMRDSKVRILIQYGTERLAGAARTCRPWWSLRQPTSTRRCCASMR